MARALVEVRWAWPRSAPGRVEIWASERRAVSTNRRRFRSIAGPVVLPGSVEGDAHRVCAAVSRYAVTSGRRQGRPLILPLLTQQTITYLSGSAICQGPGAMPLKPWSRRRRSTARALVELGWELSRSASARVSSPTGKQRIPGEHLIGESGGSRPIGLIER